MLIKKRHKTILGFTPLEKHYIFSKQKRLVLQIFSKLQHKKQKRSLTGFTLLEVVVSIVLFTILSCFIMAIVPPLIVKFRASAFKEQTIYLAKGKLEEYLYTAPAETTPPDSGILRFAAPYNNFWYRVTMASYGSNTNTNLVTVAVWGPTRNQNQTNINRVNLVGLAKTQILSSEPIPIKTFTIPWLNNLESRIFYDPFNNQIILREYHGGWTRQRGTVYHNRYDLDGNLIRTFLNENSGLAPYANFFGWAYNPVLRQWIGLAGADSRFNATPPIYSGDYQYSKLMRMNNTNISSNLVISTTLAQGGGYPPYTYLDMVKNVHPFEQIACARDGSTYILQWPANTYNLKIYICNPTTTGPLQTRNVVNALSPAFYSQAGLQYGGYTSSENYNIYYDNQRDSILLTMRPGRPQVFSIDNYAIVEYDKNLNNPRILVPQGLNFTDNGTNFYAPPVKAARDKYGNVYVLPKQIYRFVSGSLTSSSNTPILKLRETGRDARGNAVLSYVGLANNTGRRPGESSWVFGSVCDFTISPDGTKLFVLKGGSVEIYNTTP